jgi:hypothetical protein
VSYCYVLSTLLPCTHKADCLSAQTIAGAVVLMGVCFIVRESKMKRLLLKIERNFS